MSATTYFPTVQYHRRQELNFCVRDGNRCFLPPMVTDKGRARTFVRADRAQAQPPAFAGSRGIAVMKRVAPHERCERYRSSSGGSSHLTYLQPVLARTQPRSVNRGESRLWGPGRRDQVVDR